MKTFLKVAGVIVIPIGVSVIAASIAQALGGDPKYWGGNYLGMAYMMYMYEIGFLKKGFNV